MRFERRTGVAQQTALMALAGVAAIGLGLYGLFYLLEESAWTQSVEPGLNAPPPVIYSAPASEGIALAMPDAGATVRETVHLAAAAAQAMATSRPASPQVMQSAAAGSLLSEGWLKFEELNFRFEVPRAPWVRQADVNAPAGCAAFRHFGPAMHFLILAEAGEVDGMDSDQLARELVKSLRSTSPGMKVQEQTSHTVNGVRGVRTLCRILVDGVDQSFVYWSCCHNGFGYQLITQGRQTDEATVLRAADDMMGRFQILDLNRQARPVRSAR